MNVSKQKGEIIMADEKPPVTTTDAGIPAASDEHSLTAGANVRILLQDHYLIQKMARSTASESPSAWFTPMPCTVLK